MVNTKTKRNEEPKMQAITIRLNRVHAEMLKELQKQSKIFRDIEEYLIKQVELEYSKIASKKKKWTE